MAMNLFLQSVAAGACMLLCFLLLFHPLQQNRKANGWLGFFVFIMATAFISIYWAHSGTPFLSNPFYKFIISLQFLLGPAFLFSVLNFVRPEKAFSGSGLLHFIPFLCFLVVDVLFNYGKDSISVQPLFSITENISFVVRDILPFIALAYLIKSYLELRRHQYNIRLISSSLQQMDLKWLIRFLYILLMVVFIWMNDALFELPFLTKATSLLYIAAIFFLAYFSIRQKTVFDYKEVAIPEIATLLKGSNPDTSEKKDFNIAGTLESPVGSSRDEQTTKTALPGNGPKVKRLTDDQILHYSGQLTKLMEEEKLYLENELSLPEVAERLGLSIHETSFLINQSTQSNFYNYINAYRVEEAKRLLTSSKMGELNILGIAFAAGFNSKTTFNTTFKKFAGLSPSEYSQKHRNQP